VVRADLLPAHRLLGAVTAIAARHLGHARRRRGEQLARRAPQHHRVSREAY
jgi:hypothetical protein